MRCRETAQAYIVDKLRLRLSHLGIMAFEHQVLAKGQSEDAERYISSRQIGWDLRGHHARVRARHIQVNIKVRCQRIDDLFPALDFLNLIEKQIGFSIGRKTLFKLCVHLLCRHILIFHWVIAATDNALLRDVMLRFQSLHNHFQDRWLSAAAHSREDFYKWRIHISHNLLYIQRSVNHRDHLRL